MFAYGQDIFLYINHRNNIFKNFAQLGAHIDDQNKNLYNEIVRKI